MSLRQGNRNVDRRALVTWRRRYLVKAGVDPAVASQIADDLRWDIHALMDLLERGCPLHLAVRILAPADEE